MTTSALAVAGGTVLEFFAGIGLARMGLEQAGLRVVWANDIDEKKRSMYGAHFADADDRYVVDSVANISGSMVPEADVAWASFPCTDLSLAGGRRGLAGKHSSTFYEFTRILAEIPVRPRVVVVENVVGLATSHDGADLKAVIGELNDLEYFVDLMIIDARAFVPQSRPRLFIVGTATLPARTTMPGGVLRPAVLDSFFEDPDLDTHCAQLPELPKHSFGLSGIAEQLVDGDPRWWDKKRSEAFMKSLSPIQAARLAELRRREDKVYRTAYRRTRGGVPVWEIRADDVAGCLRTARGGSSRQAVVEAGHGQVRVRWMTSREYARLMGADEYNFGDATTNQVIFGFGDAVCVSAVEWLARHAIVPLLSMDDGRLPSAGDETKQEVVAYTRCSGVSAPSRRGVAG